MRTILFLALGTLPLVLAAAMTGNHILYKTYWFLDQHR